MIKQSNLPVVGIFGNGQLGRMLAQAARQMGIETIVYGPGTDSPTGEIATGSVNAPYQDLDRVREFAAQVDVITYEFENIPLATAMAASELVPVLPQPALLAIAQNRLREKTYLDRLGLPVTPFAAVNSLETLQNAVAAVGLPAVLKTAESGYDGKGQVKINSGSADELAAAWEAINQAPAVLEKWVTFEREISVVGARDKQGNFVSYGPIENEHSNHILDLSIYPASSSQKTGEIAIDAVRRIMEDLGIIGVLCVEFFEIGDGGLICNEIAPRPHNSGHLTIEGFRTSQFEQQLRTVIGLPVGDPSPLAGISVMGNLLGDLWPEGTDNDPNWFAALEDGSIKLHLYGKKAARPGRKMGHLTLTGQDKSHCIEKIRTAREALRRS